MPTMQEAGKNWDEGVIGQIVLVSPEMYPDYKEIIEGYLQEQPESWAGVCDLKQMLDGIEIGVYTPWLYRDRKGYKGMMLTSLQNYYYGGSIRIEFLSCKNFYTMMKMQKAVEHQAMLLGRNFIEAIAHPTIAKYAIKKFGCRSPGVAVRKDLRVKRRN